MAEELMTLLNHWKANPKDEVFERLCQLLWPTAMGIARKYFLMGGDREDLLQYVRIGIWQACRDYNPLKSDNVTEFTKLCVERQILTAVAAATRQKHHFLNSAVSLDKRTYEDSRETVADTISSDAPSAQDVIEHQEKLEEIRQRMCEKLGKLEKSALMLQLDGLTYDEIAAAYGVTKKSVDNALQRARRKIAENAELALLAEL